MLTAYLCKSKSVKTACVDLYFSVKTLFPYCIAVKGTRLTLGSRTLILPQAQGAKKSTSLSAVKRNMYV